MDRSDVNVPWPHLSCLSHHLWDHQRCVSLMILLTAEVGHGQTFELSCKTTRTYGPVQTYLMTCALPTHSFYLSSKCGSKTAFVKLIGRQCRGPPRHSVSQAAKLDWPVGLLSMLKLQIDRWLPLPRHCHCRSDCDCHCSHCCNNGCHRSSHGCHCQCHCHYDYHCHCLCELVR